jgi:Flp pilus assembly protein TadG
VSRGPLHARCAEWLRLLRADKRGGVAIMFALCALPLIGLAGAAIDYGRATDAQARLNTALDSALLSAGRTAVWAGADQVAAGVVRAQWQQAAAAVSGIDAADIVVSPTIVKNDQRYVSATYTATLRTHIVTILGIRSIQIGGTAEVKLESPTYTDIHLVLDVSASMGLAATDAGRQLLAKLTRDLYGPGGECTFACHTKDAGQAISNFELAQNNGIQTRIEVVQSVTNSLLDDVRAAQANTVFGPEVYRVGLYSFSGYGVDLGGARTLVSPVSNTSLARSQVASLQLDNATAYKPMLSDMTGIIGRSYEGRTPDLRRKFLIVLTDGHDYGHNWDWSKTINPADCAALKANGVGVYIFNTKWVADWGNWAFDPILGYKQNMYGGGTVFQALGPKLKECSSGEGFYYEGTDAAEIAQNFRQIFKSIQNSSTFAR